VFGWGGQIDLLTLAAAMTTAMPLCRSALQVVLALVVVLAATARGSACARGELRDQASPGSRPHSVTITEFGAVGDGRTLNTVPFQNAVFYVRSFADKGGAQLYVPRGRWVTGSFNLTSHLTLYLEQGAVIVGVKVMPAVGWGALPCFGFRFLSRVVKAVVVTEILLALAFRVCAYPFQPALAGCELVGLVLLIW